LQGCFNYPQPQGRGIGNFKLSNTMKKITISKVCIPALHISGIFVALLLIGMQLFLASTASSQTTGSIKGKVTDSKGINLPGVTVKLEGNVPQTQATDRDGNYSFTNLRAGNYTMTLTFIGFTTSTNRVTLAAGQQSVVNMSLTDENTSLGEVVITALGIKREAKSLGYSTSTVNMEALVDDRSTNVGNSLQGKFSGVNVSAAASGEGGSSKIRIRAQSSFGGDNSPLIVVDGIPINNVTNTGSARSDDGGGLQSINQDDIASMTILKGAGAAALYGFRAKDGVIIITTKSGAKNYWNWCRV